MDITRQTGGDYCLLRKDPDLCFRKAVDYSSQYYMLSYYAQPAETVRWRKIHVKVRGANLQVRARSGYFSAGALRDPEERRKYAYLNETLCRFETDNGEVGYGMHENMLIGIHHPTGFHTPETQAP